MGEAGRRAAAGPRADGNPVQQALAPWRDRLTLVALVRGLVIGLALGAFGAAMVWGWAHVWLLPQAKRIAPGAVAAGLLGGAIWALLKRPDWGQTARRVDRTLALGDRMSTALEYGEQSGPLVEVQRRDALMRLAEQIPARGFPVRVERKWLAAAGAAVVLAAAAALAPLPDRVLQQAAVRTEIEEVKQAAEEARERLEKAPLTDEQREEMRQALADLQKELAAARRQFDPEEAARRVKEALAKAEERLADLPGPGAGSRQGALAGLANQTVGDPQLGQLAEALSEQNVEAAKAALEQLAAQLEGMTAGERAELAKKLQQAGQAAKADPVLAQAMQQAGQQLATGQLSDAAASLARAAQAVAGAQTQANLAQAVTGAIGQMAQAGQGVQQAAQGNFDRRAAQQIAQGQGHGQGQGQGQGQGERQTPGAGQGGGTGGGGMSTGGRGTDWTGDPAEFETVFIPGQVGEGSPGEITQGPQGISLGGRQLPYQQVLGQYADTARQHLSNARVPDELKSVVEQYFSELQNNP